MRTIEVPLSDELLRQVDEKAHHAGLDRDEYIRSVLSKEVASEPSISEVLAAFRNQVTESGIGDDELDRLFSDAREETHRERGAHEN